MSNATVSVICNAYNHAPYIRSCLDGIVMQKTDFPVEALVHDDASTDGTADVIREYAARYPKIVKPVLQSVNQFSQGKNIGEFQYPRVTGRYIAYCEGDDYWCDPLKLQKQFDALEAHPEADICAHAATRIDANTGKVLGMVAPRAADALIPTADVIAGGGQFVATSAVMVRASLNERVPAFRQMLWLDFTLQVHGALRGGLLYLSDSMSVYRFRVPGSWSTRQNSDIERERVNIGKTLRMLEQMDIDTGGQYHEVISERARKYERRLLNHEFHYYLQHGDFRAALDDRYAECYRELPFIKRCGARLFVAAPWTYGLWKRFRHSIGEGV